MIVRLVYMKTCKLNQYSLKLPRYLLWNNSSILTPKVRSLEQTTLETAPGANIGAIHFTWNYSVPKPPRWIEGDLKQSLKHSTGTSPADYDYQSERHVPWKRWLSGLEHMMKSEHLSSSVHKFSAKICPLLTNID